MRLLSRLWAARKGYTIDQTILIVAIIAILITLIIITIGWALLTRSTGTKLGSYMKQFDSAINTFYDSNRAFPTSLGQLQAAGLTDFRTTTNASGTATYFHDVGGATGVVQLANPVNTGTNNPVGVPASTNYIVITFTGVPVAEANQADSAVDGQASATAGQVIFRTGGACSAGGILNAGQAATGSTVTVCFLAQRS